MLIFQTLRAARWLGLAGGTDRERGWNKPRTDRKRSKNSTNLITA